jgi:trimeric autotransporter adhesin
MKSLFLILLSFFVLISLKAQNVGIGTNNPNSSSMLEINSSNKGIIIPRINLLNETDVTTVATPGVSLLLFNTNNALPDGQGYYYWNGTRWIKLLVRNSLSSYTWGLSGNTGTDADSNFIGTADNEALVFKTNNILSGKIDPASNSIYFGQSAGITNSTGSNNTFLGDKAGESNSTGSNNLFAGSLAGNANSTGDANVFVGQDAGLKNSIGLQNTFVGEDAGKENIDGNENTFIGNGAGRNLTDKNNIIAIGKESIGGSNASPGFNTIAIGDRAGFNTGAGGKGLYIGSAAGYNGNGGIAIGDSASFNGSNFASIALGYKSLFDLTSGIYNVSVGAYSQQRTTNGIYNVSLGSFALNDNTSGNYNVAIGGSALSINTSGDYNTSIGYSAGRYGGINLTNGTVIGYDSYISSSNTMAFGNTDVTKWVFGGSTTPAGRAFVVGSTNVNGNGAYLTTGGTWTNTSDSHKKDDFSTPDGADVLNKIDKLPITRWKYKGTDEYHVGPTAQDFYEAFQLGLDSTSISTVDPSGIALRAIQQLIKENKELKQRIENLEQNSFKGKRQELKRKKRN